MVTAKRAENFEAEKKGDKINGGGGRGGVVRKITLLEREMLENVMILNVGSQCQLVLLTDVENLSFPWTCHECV